jgi:hypothetical protein
MLHIDHQHGGALAEADTLSHALLAIDLGGGRLGIGHGHVLPSCRGQGIAIT